MCALLVATSAARAQSPDVGDCTSAPGAPSRLTIAFNEDGRMALTWTAAAGNPSTYFLEVGSLSHFSNLSNSDLHGTGTSFYTTGVRAGTYFARVRAANACGKSDPSNEVRLVVLATLSEARRARLQSNLEQGLAAFSAPGGIVGMWFPDKGSWVVGSGIGNKATGAAAAPENYFRIGSLTKTFTATVVLQLVDEQRLSLDDKLSKFEPWVPGAAGITVRQLLNMTSGLFNYTDLDEFWEPFGANPLVPWTPRQLVDLAVANPPLSSPGQQYHYCNTNFILLGMIIEEVTGRTAAQEITTRIITRLGLTHTSFPMTPELPEPYQRGYIPVEGEPPGSSNLREFSIYTPTVFWTAGGMVSTLSDLKIWMEALADGTLLSDQMHAAQLNFSAPNTAEYGLGVMGSGGVAFGHSGEVPGYNTAMYYVPGMDATSITTMNRYPNTVEGAVDQINWVLVAIMAEDPTPAFSYFGYPDSANYGTLSWTGAFAAAHDKFSSEYAFTDWKGIDWPALYDRFFPRITQAQADGDQKAYYQALHEYVCSIPDRHVSLGAANEAVPIALGNDLAGGGFGMAVAELTDWRVIAGAVAPNGPADRVGMVAGAEILTWGGVPARTAIGGINVGAVPYKILAGLIGQEKPQATSEHYRLEQARLLVRGPIDSTVRVVFRNPGSSVSRTATLTAVDDGGASFKLLDFAKQAELSDQIDYRILPEGYGYVRVRLEKDLQNPNGYPTRLYERFKEAISTFVTAAVPGVIVDIRGNFGGSDDFAADMAGFFYTDPAFYEYQEYFDKRTGGFLRITVSDKDGIVDHLSIDPQTPHYGGPVVALVNPTTHSSGEGPAMGISRAPNGHVIGFHGTGGSFGMVGGSIGMPGGYSIEYPYGRTLDEHGVIQLDSRNGVGGVAPNPRVPMTLENVLAYAAGTDVELQYAISFLRGGGVTTPTVTWANPSSLAAGTALTGMQLNATATANGAPVAGTFVYAPPAGTVMNTLGTQSLSVSFTPTDTTSYTSVVATVNIVVTFVGPRGGGGWAGTISGSNLLYNGVTYPIVNGRVSFPDCTMYIVAPNGALLGGSTIPNCVSGTGGGGAGPAAPVITWAIPASVVAGTPLSATQLNATANVTGTFVYSPSIGTAMNTAGNQTLSVTFTPNDLTAYLVATKSVTIVVTASGGGGGFVGPAGGGGWSGTISGSNLVYNGASYPIVNGRVSFPDCTMFIVAPNGALVGRSAIPNCTPSGESGGGEPAAPGSGGGFVGPRNGGGWSGTISGSNFIYNGVTYPIVNGRVSFPDCTMFIVAPNGALAGGGAIPNCTPADGWRGKTAPH